MKLLTALMMILAALLGGIAVILNAPPHLPPEVPGFLGIAYAVAVAVILRGPIGRALVGQLGGDPGGDTTNRLSAQVDEVLDEVRMLRQEHLELHERVDFTERLLAQHRAGDLAGGERTP